ncbi:MAG: hypothetical protein EKK42_20290 [Pseudonocardiaceae bacterium]|nr:MAG: hypothetical protein EKK42_20290 [Pseudonocardiaceae bacterium]
MSKVEQLESDIRELVAEMDTWEDPYVEFYKRGVAGKRKCADTCIVANYLHVKLDGERVQVDGKHVMGWVGFDDTEYVKLPDEVVQFIRDFDAGKHPELVSADN